MSTVSRTIPQRTEMPLKAKKTFAYIGVFSLLVFAALLAGCATSRDYPGPVHGQTFNGTIKAVDWKEHRLTVAPFNAGEDTVFVWNSRTKFWRNGFPIKADVLEPIWPVRIHYHTAAGQPTAHHVYVELTYPIVH